MRNSIYIKKLRKTNSPPFRTYALGDKNVRRIRPNFLRPSLRLPMKSIKVSIYRRNARDVHMFQCCSVVNSRRDSRVLIKYASLGSPTEIIPPMFTIKKLDTQHQIILP